jgi:hypothetical protein
LQRVQVGGRERTASYDDVGEDFLRGARTELLPLNLWWAPTVAMVSGVVAEVGCVAFAFHPLTLYVAVSLSTSLSVNNVFTPRQPCQIFGFWTA